MLALMLPIVYLTTDFTRQQNIRDKHAVRSRMPSRIGTMDARSMNEPSVFIAYIEAQQ